MPRTSAGSPRWASWTACHGRGRPATEARARSAPVRTLAGRTIVAVELAGRGDGQADRRTTAGRPDVVIVHGRRVDEVARARADDRLVLDFPVDLALHDEPPLVHQMVVPVGPVTRRLADQRADDLIVDDDLLRPRRRALGALQLVDARVQRAGSEQALDGGGW